MRDIRPMTQEYEGYCRDESRSVGYADSISFPETEEEVREILSGLYPERVPVTIQGGRTGLAGAAVPYGGHILNLSKMNRIRGIRRAGDRYYLRVDPGVVLSVLRKAIEDRNMDVSGWTSEEQEVFRAFAADRPYFFPTDPTETSACIGGMAACNASGARTYMYGSARDHISAIRVVLCDGSLVTLRRGECMARERELTLPVQSEIPGEKCSGTEAIVGKPAGTLRLALPTYIMPKTKNASGYYIADDMDAVDLFVGSDGTLGVLTEIELELLPLPEVVWGVSCFFADEGQAMEFTIRMRQELERVAALEYFDGPALEILRRQKQKSAAFSALPDVPAGAGCCVYVELHGDEEAEVLQRLYQVGGIMQSLGGREEDTWVARTRIDRETQQFFRHAVPESVNMLIDERKRRDPVITKLAADMSVPDECLREVMALYRRTLKENHLETAVWGHIGNNHLHVNILPRNAEDYRRGKELYSRWAEEITRMGGAVSAEHGVGKLKRDYLAVMYGEEHVREMAALKRTLDPFGIFGRGNLFAERY